jgi:hypothetical protein
MSDWLSYLFGVEGACRVFTLLSIASLPLAVALFLRAHGRPAVLGSLAAGVALHTYVFWGFINFAAGMSLAFISLAALARLTEKPGARYTLLFGLASLLTFYAHAQMYLWMALACIVQLGAMALASGRKQAFRAGWRAALAAIPSMAAAVYWICRSGVLEHGDAGARSGPIAELASDPLVWASPVRTLFTWPKHSFHVYLDGTGIVIAVAFLAAVFFFIALRVRAFLQSRKSKDRPARQSLAPEAVLLLAALAYLFAPQKFRLIDPISYRFLPVALALAPVLGPRLLGRSRLRLLCAGVLLVPCLCAGLIHTIQFKRTDREMGDLDQALEQTQPGKKLLGLIFDRQSRILSLSIYLHAHQYYQSRVGGLAAFSFVEFHKSPVQYRKYAAPPLFPVRFEWDPHKYDHRNFQDYFDYWLVRHLPDQLPSGIFKTARNPPEPIYQGKRWTVFARPVRGSQGWQMSPGTQTPSTQDQLSHSSYLVQVSPNCFWARQVPSTPVSSESQ